MNEPTQPNPFAVAGKVQTLADLLKKENYRQRFEQVLGERAPQFISSILSLGATMKDVEPRSILAAAAIAAALDLPLDKNLGFAHIVPYKKGERKYGQFQMGYKGYIQLAQRSGQYERMNAKPVNAEAYIGRDAMGEPVIDWTKFDPAKPIAYYFFGFRSTSGFEKKACWSVAEVEFHAKRYSQAYRGGYETPWKTHFDAMALKTVISNELRKWGPLSVQIQRGISEDQSVRRDIDAEPEQPDWTDSMSAPQFDEHKADIADAKATATEMGLAPATLKAPLSEPKKRGRPPKSSAPVQEQATITGTPPGQAAETPAAGQPAPSQTTPQPAQSSPSMSNVAAPRTDLFGPGTPINTLTELMEHSQVTEAEVIDLCRRRNLAAKDQELAQLHDDKLKDLIESWPVVAAQIRVDRKARTK